MNRKKKHEWERERKKEWKRRQIHTHVPTDRSQRSKGIQSKREANAIEEEKSRRRLTNTHTHTRILPKWLCMWKGEKKEEKEYWIMNVRSRADEVVDKPMLNSSHSNHSYAATALWCFCERGKTVSLSQSLWVHILVRIGFTGIYFGFVFLVKAHGIKLYLRKNFWDFVLFVEQTRENQKHRKKIQQKIPTTKSYWSTTQIKYDNSENFNQNETYFPLQWEKKT